MKNILIASTIFISTSLFAQQTTVLSVNGLTANQLAVLNQVSVSATCQKPTRAKDAPNTIKVVVAFSKDKKAPANPRERHILIGNKASLFSASPAGLTVPTSTVKRNAIFRRWKQTPYKMSQTYRFTKIPSNVPYQFSLLSRNIINGKIRYLRASLPLNITCGEDSTNNNSGTNGGVILSLITHTPTASPTNTTTPNVGPTLSLEATPTFTASPTSTSTTTATFTSTYTPTSTPTVTPTPETLALLKDTNAAELILYKTDTSNGQLTKLGSFVSNLTGKCNYPFKLNNGETVLVSIGGLSPDSAVRSFSVDWSTFTLTQIGASLDGIGAGIYNAGSCDGYFSFAHPTLPYFYILSNSFVGYEGTMDTVKINKDTGELTLIETGRVLNQLPWPRSLNLYKNDLTGVSHLGDAVFGLIIDPATGLVSKNPNKHPLANAFQTGHLNFLSPAPGVSRLSERTDTYYWENWYGNFLNISKIDPITHVMTTDRSKDIPIPFPGQIVLDPAKNYVVVTSGGVRYTGETSQDKKLFIFKIEDNGDLTKTSEVTIYSGKEQMSNEDYTLFDPTGKFIYFIRSDEGTVYVYNFNSDTGVMDASPSLVMNLSANKSSITELQFFKR